MRVVSVAHLGLMPDLPHPGAGTDAADARFWPVADLSTPDGPELAFDHQRIVTDGVESARSLLEATNIATSFVEAPFTIADLRRVYESVWGVPLHPANFRRKVLSVPDLVVPTGEERGDGTGLDRALRSRTGAGVAAADAAAGIRAMTAATPPGRGEVLASVHAALSRGEYLEAFDRTVVAAAADGGDLELAYLATLALVRAGAPGQAVELLEPLAHAASARDDLPESLVEDIAALGARLAKDRALRDRRRRSVARGPDRGRAVRGDLSPAGAPLHVRQRGDHVAGRRRAPPCRRPGARRPRPGARGSHRMLRGRTRTGSRPRTARRPSSSATSRRPRKRSGVPQLSSTATSRVPPRRASSSGSSVSRRAPTSRCSTRWHRRESCTTAVT